MPLNREDELLFENSELVAGLDSESDKWEVIVKYHGDIRMVAAAIVAQVEILSENYAIITLEADKIESLELYTEIEHVELPKYIRFTLRDAIWRACIGFAQSDADFELKGSGVVVAVADSGIDYTHPDFRNPDGSSRIIFFWDQAAIGEPKPPSGFQYGVEYTKAELDAALLNNIPFMVIPELDYIGHGTAVAGVAAGNGAASGGQNIGAAPEASIIGVRLGRNGERSFVRNTELMRAIKYIIDKSQKLNMPVSINISYGANNGSHDGQSLFETYIDDMCAKWKTSIVVAAGNEGTGGHHYQGQLTSRSAQIVDFHTSGGLKEFFIDFWEDFGDDFFLELMLPNGSSTGEISYVTPTRSMRFGNVAVYAQYSQPTHYTENQDIFFQIMAITGVLPQGQWRLRVRSGTVVTGRFNVWLPVTEAVTVGTGFNTPSPESTITIPATAARVISVGGYDYRINAIAPFSGRGFTRKGDIKPDLVAPAVDILAPRRGGGYDTFSGTSIAAPFVTGAAALMMEWGIIRNNDRFLYGERLKAFLKSGATRLANVQYPSPEWGYGSLCLRQTMEELVKYQTL
ncbi:MAG: S8 family serine peptidase [Clostridiales bacterium]|jgi:subtilisin family serine protease|nr:S8 family serine peptidase [Clostridiales bacterium]